MKRFLKILLITAVVLVVAAFGGVWYLNRWLQSPETHAHVEHELSRALKLPLKFKSLELSLLGGLRAEGITVPDGDANFFEAASFSAKHRILPLFRGAISLDDVTIDSPKFTLTQHPDGKWRLPVLPEDKKQTPPKSPKTADTAPKAKSSAAVSIERLTITNGSASLFDKDKKPYLSAQGLRISLKDVRNDKIEGRVIIPGVILHGTLAITDFNAGVSYSDAKGFIIPDFIAKCGGGTLSGGYSRKDGKPTSRFTLRATLSAIDLTRAALDGDAPPPNLTGLLDSTFEVRGTDDDTKTLAGKGTITLRNGSCREIEFVRPYIELLQIAEASSFSITHATSAVEVWNGRFNIKPLTITAPPLLVTATGVARLDGKLDLDATVSVEAAFFDTRPSLGAHFTPADASGRRGLPFNVFGTLTKPRNDLREKLAGSKDSREQRKMAIEAAVESVFGPGEKPPPKPEPKPRK